jgi:hypothetical protein
MYSKYSLSTLLVAPVVTDNVAQLIVLRTVHKASSPFSAQPDKYRFRDFII